MAFMRLGSASETPLHKEAKRIVLESSELILPALTLKSSGFGVVSKILPRQRFKYIGAVTEYQVGGVRPDVILHAADGSILFVEIFVSSRVSHTKKQLIKGLNVNTIEIDVSTGYCSFDTERLKKDILSGKQSAWVYNKIEKPFVDILQNTRRYIAVREINCKGVQCTACPECRPTCMGCELSEGYIESDKKKFTVCSWRESISFGQGVYGYVDPETQQISFM